MTLECNFRKQLFKLKTPFWSLDMIFQAIELSIGWYRNNGDELELISIRNLYLKSRTGKDKYLK